MRVNEGDTLVIDVHNHLTNSTSLHWHGFLQNGTNFMDGTVGVTNCGIPPGASFRYEFKADGLRGTYWYHPHLSTQRVDGMFGPLVVHSPAENLGLEYATDRVVMVQDYYHDLSMALLPQYLAPDNENAEPVPDGALINGRNVVECAKVGAQRRCDTSSAALEALNLDGSVAHRLRFINVGAFAEFDISLDEHTVSLVEVDGTAVVPHPINRFRISVAQRYSVILPARQHQGSAFWLRATMNTHCFAETPDTLDAEVKAIVRYSPNAPIPSTTAWTSSSSSSSSLACKDLNLTEVRMSAGSPAPPPRADLLIPLRTNFEIGAYQLSRGFFNQTSWRPSTTPTLHTAISNLHSANKSFTLPQNQALTSAYDPTRQLVVKLTTAKTVDLLIDNYDDGAHPVHLHGYKFWVIASGTGYLDLDSEYPALDGATAVLRDTATVEGFGWVLIRFVADNPGMWALHCELPAVRGCLPKC